LENDNADPRQSLEEYKCKSDEMWVKSKEWESTKEELVSTKQQLEQVKSVAAAGRRIFKRDQNQHSAKRNLRPHGICGGFKATATAQIWQPNQED
jgi:hypothetical protein